MSADATGPAPRRSVGLLTAAACCLLLGYVLLSVPPANGQLTRALAPPFLCLGYCVLVPLALLSLRPGSSQRRSSR